MRRRSAQCCVSGALICKEAGEIRLVVSSQAINIVKRYTRFLADVAGLNWFSGNGPVL